MGLNILSHLSSLEYAFPGVLHHHESYDGRGYPHGLRGESIPIEGRILAIADAYDAMTSCRPYRNAMSFEKAEAIIRDGAGKQWDPALVEKFLSKTADVRRLCEKKAVVVDLVDSALRSVPETCTLFSQATM